MRLTYAHPLSLSLLLALGAFGAGVAVTRAAATSGLGGGRIVATVGSARIGAAELEQRMRSTPWLQLLTLDIGGRAGPRQLLEAVMIPEMLFAEAAESRRLAGDPAVRARIDEVLRGARVRSLLGGLKTSEGDVAAYYETHRSLFESPLRVGLWRILCATPEEARSVLAEAKSGINAWRWKDMSREHSTDKATKWRGGDLGFVAADGASTEAGLRVDPALFAAAERVRDGEVVPDPVPEGTGYAVVWRRESMPPTARTLEQESDGIRQVLVRRKLEEAVRDLVGTLRRAAAVETHPELLAALDEARNRPGPQPPTSAQAKKPIGSPQPSTTPRGLR